MASSSRLLQQNITKPMECCRHGVVSAVFLVQELIFTHRPYQCWMRLSGNFLCRVDWHFVRGTAQPERTILPILDVLT